MSGGMGGRSMIWMLGLEGSGWSLASAASISMDACGRTCDGGRLHTMAGLMSKMSIE
jgi:hypothetical protein